MNMFIILFLGYGLIGVFIANQLHIVTTKYKVKCNGYKFIVRSNKGKFVAMPRMNISGFFDLLSLSY